MMDRNSPASMQETTTESIRAALRLFDKWDGANDGRLRYVFTPRFAGSSSMDLMQRTSAAARERNAFLQSHLSENRAEVDWIRSLFPRHSSYTDVYDSAGMLGPRTIMAHCIHLADDEVSVLARSSTNVAFCPYSNRFLRSGVMPYAKLKAAGLKIGLGTDIAGGPSLSMLRQMGEALSSANADEPSLSPAGALYLATLGGARILQLDDRIGSFDAGKDADFVVVDWRRLDPLCGTGAYDAPGNILSRICYNGDTECVTGVYVRGERVKVTD
jgi:guanine deaminase